MPINAAYTPMPWGEYRSPDDTATGMNLRGSYRYFDDHFADDRGNINHGNLRWRYWGLKNKAEYGYDFDLQTNAFKARDIELNYDVSANANFKKYPDRQRDYFLFGGVDNKFSAREEGVSFLAKLGIGKGRYYNVNPLIQAGRIEEKLIAAEYIKEPFGTEVILDIAEKTALSQTVAARVNQIARYLQEQEGLEFESSTAAMNMIRDVLQMPNRQRNYGWEIKTGVSYPLSVYEGREVSTNLLAEAKFAIPLSFVTQFNLSGQISTPVFVEEELLNASLEGDLSHELTDNIDLRGQLSYNLQQREERLSFWSLRGSGEFQINENLSMILSTRVTDFTRYEEATFDFNTTFNYKIF